MRKQPRDCEIERAWPRQAQTRTTCFPQLVLTTTLLSTPLTENLPGNQSYIPIPRTRLLTPQYALRHGPSYERQGYPRHDGRRNRDRTLVESASNTPHRKRNEVDLRTRKLRKHAGTFSRSQWRVCEFLLSLRIRPAKHFLGYYDGVIFHRCVTAYMRSFCEVRSSCVDALMRGYRIVPGFLVQTGDRTGTGGGGESFYGGEHRCRALLLGLP